VRTPSPEGWEGFGTVSSVYYRWVVLFPETLAYMEAICSLPQWRTVVVSSMEDAFPLCGQSRASPRFGRKASPVLVVFWPLRASFSLSSVAIFTYLIGFPPVRH
jgi:hypothetical protein